MSGPSVPGPEAFRLTLTRACGACPFSRRVRPGATGGADPRRYVGQAAGPFWLPCHAAAGFEAEPRDTGDGTTARGVRRGMDLPQCAGAAIYRANCGYDDRFGGAAAAALHRLPADRAAVFATPAELLGHHLGVSPAAAAEILRAWPVERCLEVELGRRGVDAVPVTAAPAGGAGGQE